MFHNFYFILNYFNINKAFEVKYVQFINYNCFNLFCFGNFILQP